MKKYLNKDSLSNVVFVILIAALIYSPSRVWIMRQLAFAPSVTDVDNREQLKNYNWQLGGINTADLDFSKLKGNVVLVNFWATWCPSCRAEKPMLNDLYQEFKDEVKFVTISNEEPGMIIDYNEKNNIDLPVYSMRSNPPEIFTRTNAIPASYVFDKKGNLVMKKTGAGNWTSNKVRKTLNLLISE